MKKILLMMLLTFTTMASADEGRYTMISASESGYSMWVLDSDQGRVKHCYMEGLRSEDKVIRCKKWKDLNED